MEQSGSHLGNERAHLLPIHSSSHIVELLDPVVEEAEGVEEVVTVVVEVEAEEGAVEEQGRTTVTGECVVGATEVGDKVIGDFVGVKVSMQLAPVNPG
ncbi:hypothetical protein CYMTET_19273 [Cymbomonas tetramitiformis]|uniref:Uncharacterized protein n=1 Tax=Cymbomonas tetramitiformis TaxID=36881 RepID=A0AAE0G6D8_9CHLO|nr:hypothetical protein CYMTET_19273 [Cymbomonas tetramitiformis]